MADERAVCPQAAPPAPKPRPKLSPRRWLLLAGVCTFGFLNGFVNEITAILSTLTELLGLPLDQYVYIGQLFNYIKPLAALPSAWLVDRFGLPASMLVALALALVRNCSRALLFWAPQPDLDLDEGRAHSEHDSWQQLKFVYWSLSCVGESLVIVLYFTCLPLKISESWFAPNERSLAWSCIYMVPFVGASLAALLLPRLVVEAGRVHLLAELNLLCALISALVVLAALPEGSRPEEAPSERSSLAERRLARPEASFWADLRNVLNFDLVLLLLAGCTFEAMNAAIKSLWQDVLASLGLSAVFCGNLLAANSLVMISMQLLGSWRMDSRQADAPQPSEEAAGSSQTRALKRLLACQWATFTLQLASLALGQRLVGPRNQWWLLAGCILAHSAMSCWSAPHFNDMQAALVVGRLSQSTISAVRLSCYILLSNPYQSLFVLLRRPASAAGPVSYGLSLAFAGLMVSSVSLVFVVCFSGRRQPESEAATNTETEAELDPQEPR